MAKDLPFRLILASASVGRRYLLSRDGYAFDVQPSNVDEPMDAQYPSVRALVEHIAWLKASAVAVKALNGIVLAADSVGWIDGEVIGKPADESDARRILRLLSGREHELWTGVCLWRRPDDLQLAWQEYSRVALRALTDDEIDSYLATRTWRGCSGAYAVQEDGRDPYVTILEGSLTNVIGLPMEHLEARLRALATL